MKTILLNYLRHLRTQAQEKNNWLISTFMVTTGFLLLLAIISIIHHQSVNVSDSAVQENRHSQIVLKQLSAIRSQLQQLAANSQHADFKTALMAITQDLSAIHQSVGELATAAQIQKISSQLAVMQNTADFLKQAVASSTDTKQYLDPKTLPFQIIAIDVIAQQPFISVDYQHHVTALAVGDSLAGWQVREIHYTANTAELANAQGQYIQVGLQG